MTKGEFFTELNRYAEVLQSTAREMAATQEQAQWLYLETIHQGIKDRGGLKQHSSFLQGLLHRMRCILWRGMENCA